MVVMHQFEVEITFDDGSKTYANFKRPDIATQYFNLLKKSSLPLMYVKLRNLRTREILDEWDSYYKT